MPTIQAGDLDVGCVLEGDVGAPVVMLAHGVMTNHRLWDEVAALLAPRWRVLRYDLRGHGETSLNDAPYTLRQLAEDGVQLLDALQIERAHFIGSSLGGMVGQQLGARHGERLLTLTLCNTTAVQADGQAWTERIALAKAQGLAPLVEPTLRRWFTEAAFTGQAALVDKMRGIARASSVQGYVGAAGAIRELDQVDLLARITTPTLIVAGSEDQATPLAQSRALQCGIAGSRFAVLPAAHQAAAECPAQFVGLWTEFVAEHRDRLDQTDQETRP